jgi:membrane protease YdiL (CAAX protease family)
LLSLQHGGSKTAANHIPFALLMSAHAYYHWVVVAPMIQGWLLGLLVYWRKSLRPGMLAHGLQDALGGLVSFFS